ncbi:hypothetical protein [Rhodococcus opacus]
MLALRDLEPGARWGLLDSDGRPKAPWLVMRRMSLPVAVLLAEDGLDGLRIDGQRPRLRERDRHPVE